MTTETQVEPTQRAELPEGTEWFVIHTYAGYENKVKQNLEARIASMDMQSKIFRVVVPTEDEIEIKNGKRTTVQRKIFPGYVLVAMLMEDQSWHVVRNTPGVTGFVSSGTKPVPLQPGEVKAILKQSEQPSQPVVRVDYRKGQSVKIIDGPFIEFLGVVDAVMPDQNKVRVLVSFFGRETPVELDFLQVEKS